MRVYIVRDINILNFPERKTLAVFSTLEKARFYCKFKRIAEETILGVEVDTNEFGLSGEAEKIDSFSYLE